MATDHPYTREDLVNLKPQHKTFVGIDSDGCVFDTMEIKQKRCFHGLIVSHWHLEPIEKYVRETAEFANLYSVWRGQNRFVTLVRMFDLLRTRPEVQQSGLPIPTFPKLQQFMDSGIPLGNPELEKAVQETRDPELSSLLQWSQAVNAEIERIVKNVPAFPWAVESLKKIAGSSDAICVSQTPTEALVREWEEHGITKYVSVIAGQELGTKTEHIALATKGKYKPASILMIGDAPGDRKAAKANHALFYPINPGQEAASWKRFYTEAYDKFLTGSYAGPYEERLIADFDALLPETPPWEKKKNLTTENSALFDRNQERVLTGSTG